MRALKRHIGNINDTMLDLKKYFWATGTPKDVHSIGHNVKRCQGHQ
jgi:hypothetical protein